MKNDELEGVRIDPVTQPHMVWLRVDRIIDWQLAARIFNLLKRAETEPIEMILPLRNRQPHRV